MQLRYVFTELRQGLRRNLSMHLAVVLTLLVSLTLAGIGVLMHQQADLTEKVWGNELQITFYLCNGVDDHNAGCTGPVDHAQEQAIVKELKDNKFVESFTYETKKQAFARYKAHSDKRLWSGRNAVVRPADLWDSYWVTMKDPHDAADIEDAVAGLDGVDHYDDNRAIIKPILGAMDGLQTAALVGAILLVIAALLLVANTIRLAAHARRREIGIMRLVGASTLYIALPFLLEALVTAVVGIILAGGALALAVWLAVEKRLSHVHWTYWVSWHQYAEALGIIAILGVALTLIPTLLLTRKYLKV